MAIQPPILLSTYLLHEQVTQIAEQFEVTRQTVYNAMNNPPAPNATSPRLVLRRKIYAYCCNMVRANFLAMQEVVNSLPTEV